jgi:hypothetical protein
MEGTVGAAGNLKKKLKGRSFQACGWKYYMLKSWHFEILASIEINLIN